MILPNSRQGPFWKAIFLPLPMTSPRCCGMESWKSLSTSTYTTQAMILLADNTSTSILHFFLQGGLFMWPLITCSVVSLAVIILRGFALRRNNVMPPQISRGIEELQPVDDAEAVVKLARIVRGDPSPLGRI